RAARVHRTGTRIPRAGRDRDHAPHPFRRVLADLRHLANRRVPVSRRRMTLRASNALGSMPVVARMRTVDERVVRAPVERMFQIAFDVERWPELLPHYRTVRFRERMHGTGIVEMSANRPFGPFNWPTWWISLMEVQQAPGMI